MSQANEQVHRGDDPGFRPTVRFPGDRLPPQNLEAERGLLGAVLIDNGVLPDVMVEMDATDLYREAHQAIYRAVLDLNAAGRPADPITLADELTRRGEFERVGGLDTLTELCEAPAVSHAKFYAQIVRQKAIARGVMEAANSMLRDVYSDEYTADEALARAMNGLLRVGDRACSREARPAADIAAEAMDRLRRRAGGEYTGLTTGFPELDAATDGFHAGQLVIVAARPAMGKSAWVLNFAEHVAVQWKLPCLLFSLEMNELEIGERLLAGMSRVSTTRLRQADDLGEDEWRGLDVALSRLRGAPLLVDDSPSRTVGQVGAIARRVKMRMGLGAVVVDYVQLVRPEESKGIPRHEQVAAISRRLKMLAMELRVPVVALSQLNRECEARADKRPLLSDLRESGALEQDSDIVLLLHRPSYYDPNDRPGEADLIVAKNRSGQTGVVRLLFRAGEMRFRPADYFDGPAF